MAAAAQVPTAFDKAINSEDSGQDFVKVCLLLLMWLLLLLLLVALLYRCRLLLTKRSTVRVVARTQ